MAKEKLTPQQALSRGKHYCAYQERSHSEVKEKLYDFGLCKNDVEEIMSKLIEENYLNEERFALHFAGGKFRMKKWGMVKIRFELKKKQVSEYSIKKALSSIDEEEYQKVFEKHVADKLKTLSSEKNIFIKKRKLQDYLRQKGYETDLIRTELNKV